eukprot:7290822-Pyramimonas_sp.AAC.1
MVQCFGVQNRRLQYLFDLSSGIIQGCPASGALYAVGSHPMLAAFHDRLDRHRYALTRACADDVGSALAKLCFLE